MSDIATRKPSPNLGYLIFASRWLQVPLYLGLIVAQAVYVWQFLRELWHLAEHVFSAKGMEEAEIMLAVLGLVDVVMIANLLIMVIIGGYETFVSRIKLDQHPDQPEWLSHVNANVLKTKLAMSIIGISSIHLLATFIKANTFVRDGLTEVMLWQTIIHIAFILSAMALAWIDKIGQRPQHGASGRLTTSPPVPTGHTPSAVAPSTSGAPASAATVDS